MGELLGFLGVLAALWFLASPFVTLVISLRARRHAEALEHRIFGLEQEIILLRQRPPVVVEKQIPAPVVVSAPPQLAPPPPRMEPPAPLQPTLQIEPPPLAALSLEPASPRSAATPTGIPEPALQTPEIAAPPNPEPAPVVAPISEPRVAPIAAPTASIKPWSPSIIPSLPGLNAESADSEKSAAPAFDIEKLLGVRGAAWLGAIALAIAGTLFAKYSIENNLIPPALRIAMLIVLGTVALIASEWPLRPRYIPTANSVAGGGIAVLYSAFYAGHSLYGLFDTKLTFALMILTTVVAALMSMRYSAMFIAGLGLVGGFATPILLSTNQDRPVALFLYVLLLDVGFLAMAVRRGWHGLTLLSLLLTLGIEAGWLCKRLTPEKLPIGVGAATLFALVYLTLPSLARRFGPNKEKSGEAEKADPNQTLFLVGMVGGLAPFLLALYLAGTPAYLPKWPLLYGFMACLDAALLVVAVLRGEVAMLVAGALATAVAQNMSALDDPPEQLWQLSLATIGLYLLPNLAGRLSRFSKFWQDKREESGPRELLEAAGLLALFGLAVFTANIVNLQSAKSPWLTWTLFVALFVLLCERGGPSGRRFVHPIGALALGGLVLWRVLAATMGHEPLSSAATLVPREFAAPVLLAVVYGALASWRSLRADSAAATSHAKEIELAGFFAVLFGLMGLFYALPGSLSANPLPLLPCLVIYNMLLFCTALRQNWTALLPLSLSASALLVAGWHETHFQRADISYALLVYDGFVLAFLAAPLGLVYMRRRAWQGRRGPYLAAALAGPAFFFPVYDAVTKSIGNAAIGILPLLFAFLSVLGLVAVQRLPKLPADWLDEKLAARRLLGNRALFAAVALAFITLAVPLQLHNQWVIVAWALQAAAVMRLFQVLPHPGLKYFGFALFGLVTFRLLLDPSVLHMQARGYIIFNWLLYTYGLPAACFIVGGMWLRQVEVEKHDPWERELFGEKPRLATLISFVGLILCFALINLQIADAFSTGRFVELSWERDYARDLVTSLSWAIYAVALLLIGMWRRNRALRFVSLGFLVLTIGKVFLLDLSNLRGVYRPLSFLGLAGSLIIVSLLYQRFVFQKDKKGSADVG